jgi:hypothetical protein
VVRDGRSVVASGEKSFKWDFEKAAYDWNTAVFDILKFIQSSKKYQSQILLVKYEDIFLNTVEEMKKILSFLKLKEANYDWEKAMSLGISGSSETVDQYGQVKWNKKMAKSENFKPLSRFDSWSHFKKRRFEWIAGPSLKALGYNTEIKPFSFAEKLLQKILSCSWCIRVLPKVIYYALVKKNFILKTH